MKSYEAMCICSAKIGSRSNKNRFDLTGARQECFQALQNEAKEFAHCKITVYQTFFCENVLITLRYNYSKTILHYQCSWCCLCQVDKRASQRTRQVWNLLLKLHSETKPKRNQLPWANIHELMNVKILKLLFLLLEGCTAPPW